MYSNSLFKFTPGQKEAFGQPRPYPNSTLRKIIFPFNKSKNEYDIEFYQSFMTNELMTKFEIDVFFKQLYSQVEYFNHFKSLYLRRLIPCSIQIPLVLLFLSILLHVCIINDYARTSSMGIVLIVFDIIFVLWTGFGIMGVIKTHQRVECDTRMRIAHFINQQNSGYFTMRGMKWTLPEAHFNWMELHLDFKVKQEAETYYQVLNDIVATELAVLIFPLDEKTLTYDFDFYKVTLTDNALSRSEVDIFLNRLQSCAQSDMKKFQSRNKSLIIPVVAVIVGIIGLIMKHSPNEVESMSIIHLENVILVLYFLLVWVFFVKGNEYFKKVREDIINKIQFEVVNENANLINQEVRWYSPADDYRWIELWLDYRYIHDDRGRQKQEEQEVEDIHKYRFREAETLPLYQWGQHFNFGLKPLDKVELDCIRLSTPEDQEKMLFGVLNSQNNQNNA